MGEAAMKHITKGNADYEIDSAGTAAYHVGNLADPRMRATASKHGIEITSRAREFVAEDFNDFDYILVMDDSNYRNVLSLASSKEDEQKVFKLRYFDDEIYKNEDVPDPYYGGDAGFENVYQMVMRSCKNLKEYLDAQ